MHLRHMGKRREGQDTTMANPSTRPPKRPITVRACAATGSSAIAKTPA